MQKDFIMGIPSRYLFLLICLFSILFYIFHWTLLSWLYYNFFQSTPKCLILYRLLNFYYRFKFWWFGPAVFSPFNKLLHETHNCTLQTDKGDSQCRNTLCMPYWRKNLELETCSSSTFVTHQLWKFISS